MYINTPMYYINKLNYLLMKINLILQINRRQLNWIFEFVL